MGNQIATSWAVTFQDIKRTHDAAYRAIEEAITYEEQEQPTKAIDKYKEGILLIDKALDIRVTCPEEPDFTWEQAALMIQKMKKTRAEVLTRINSLTSVPNLSLRELPPTYEEAICSTSTQDTPRTYNDLAVALNNLQIESTNEPLEIIYSHDGVLLYFISPDGTVQQTSKPETLNIALIPGTETVSRKVFLQIGDWIYPLIPGVSPCFRTDYGAFILPDVYSDTPGASIGIILPADADESVYELLENILHGIICESTKKPSARVRRAAEPFSVTKTIANGFSTGGYYVSHGLITGAQKLSSFLNYGTPKLINHLTPATEITTISPTVTKSFQIVSSTSSTAADLTAYIADKVGYATQALGRYLAPHIQTQGTRLLSSGFNLSAEEASLKMTGILTVAAGAVEGFSTVYSGLETSASILGQSLSNNTVNIVQHKYGSPAGQIANSTFQTVGNVLTIGHNTKFFTPKGIVKVTAKETGKAIVEDMKHLNSHELTSNQNLYPNLTSTENLPISSDLRKDRISLMDKPNVSDHLDK